MVNVTVAGGTSSIAREVIDVLVASQRHEIVILTRSTSPQPPFPPGVAVTVVNYDDPSSLQHVLAGTHTLLSFLQLLSEAGQIAQRNLIEAAVAARVKRIAPSEWASKTFTDMSFYNNKQAHRDQLEHLSRTSDFEYTLFQPGLLLEYLAAPHKTTAHLDPLMTVFDFAGCRAMVVEGHEADVDAMLTLTSVTDLAKAVLAMIDLPDRDDEKEGVEWPRIGGICGNRLTVLQILELFERVRGQTVAITKLQMSDLEAGELKSPWTLQLAHRSVSAEESADMLKAVAISMLLSFTKGAWDCSGEVNKLLPPDFRFIDAEEFLRGVWEGRTE
ncbi:hypothetical protein Micbo1qcDRAFT_221592 [Microdochium bolleyi]|uniref:NmrA-like domain-containing protein n=1 Tax=Microdochium bolleyi TaxID=196109 RepID=A0A136ILG9_9PEZI|nr:hypothetical protein Micbo1qcDRAFT_221592 [Microdochium bolleyi]